MDREAWSAAVHGGHEKLDMTEQLNWTEGMIYGLLFETGQKITCP